MIFYTVSAETRNNILKISFLDIGQGDSIFIESPSGNQVLLDAGPDKSILSALGRVMPIYDRSIDMIIATHPDADHIGGIPEVMKNYSVANYIYNGATGTTGIFQELVRVVDEQKIPTHIARRGEVIDIGGGAHLDILYPDRDPYGTDTNEFSIVAELIYGDTKVILTGDAPTDVEDRLVGIDHEKLKSDILKVAHHGSRNSLSPAFFSSVNPYWAVISSGKDNRYGHPHKEIIDSLDSMGINILITSDVGDVNFVSDGKNLNMLQ